MHQSLAEQTLPLSVAECGPEIFCHVVAALDHPGRTVRVDRLPEVPYPLFKASAAVLAILLDRDSPLWIDLDWRSSAAVWLQECCASSLVTEPSMAHAALITRPACMPPLDQFRIGDPENPVPPATLIVQVEELTTTISPFSPTTHCPRKAPSSLPRGLCAGFWDSWSLLCRTYPPGLNVLFTWQDLLSVLPNPPARQ